MKQYEFWFIVGSQTLYGEEVLATVTSRAEITQVVKEANFDDSCAGIVTWCHTFSPSKMWINGLKSRGCILPRGITARFPMRKSTWTS